MINNLKILPHYRLINLCKTTLKEVNKDLVIHCYNSGKEYLKNNYDKPYQILCRPLSSPVHSVKTKLKELGLSQSSIIFNKELYNLQQVYGFLSIDLRLNYICYKYKTIITYQIILYIKIFY